MLSEVGVDSVPLLRVTVLSLSVVSMDTSSLEVSMVSVPLVVSADPVSVLEPAALRLENICTPSVNSVAPVLASTASQSTDSDDCCPPRHILYGI